MNIFNEISQVVKSAISELYAVAISNEQIALQKTRKEFEGDVTLVVFPLLSITKSGPEPTATAIGNYLLQHTSLFTAYQVVKGFLNLTVHSRYYLNRLNHAFVLTDYGITHASTDATKYVVEHSSPNTNKPLHLGHVRNNLLGYSLCRILEANGHSVVKTNLINDRGIHICKSMLAWQKWGRGETPETTGMKGDHLIGKYYVLFDTEYKKQVTMLVRQGMNKEQAGQKAELLKEAQEMLRLWEAGDKRVTQLWKTMNAWVYDGFEATYNRLGVSFDKVYYESDTYLVGKKTVIDGLDNGIFYRKKDGSVWVDLSDKGLDEKILLRSDGTSVYMTQDIGTAQLRQDDFGPDKMIYVVGNEQDYHFKVLAHILDILGYHWSGGLQHLSYGMVELPEGKMKSREGTVVDADDLMDEMITTAQQMAAELGKLDVLTEQKKEETYRIIGLGALKYFILKVDPAKNMTFNPRESIDFNGHTGPFIQYTYTRIRSVMRKAAELNIIIPETVNRELSLSAKEKNILKLLEEFPAAVREAGDNYSPAFIANFVYELAREYNAFYHDHTIVKEPDGELRNFRLVLSQSAAWCIQKAMGLLGIEVPDRM
jgi:arginyl-tRNA synthetase